MGEDGIKWPERFEPKACPVFVSNEIDIPASPERVWAWLTAATTWPSWYPNSGDVQLPEGSRLQPEMEFRWRTFGVSLVSWVEEFEPYTRLGWHAKGMGVDCYHAWLITETPEGCHVLTQETQHGWLARLGNIFLPKRMGHHHQIWLEQLSMKAQSGLP